MSMHIDPDPRGSRGAITRCPQSGCHALLLTDDAAAHARRHTEQHEWEEGVDAALDGGISGVDLAPWPAAADGRPLPDAAAPAEVHEL
jgi:hypothetical protein